MDVQIKQKIEQAVGRIAELERENEALKQKLDTCIGTINNVFGKLMNKNNQLDMQKVMGLITNPSSIQKSIEELIIVIEQHGNEKGEA